MSYRTPIQRPPRASWQAKWLCPLGIHSKTTQWRPHTKEPLPVCTGLPEIHHHLYWRCNHCLKWFGPVRNPFANGILTTHPVLGADGVVQDDFLLTSLDVVRRKSDDEPRWGTTKSTKRP